MSYSLTCPKNDIVAITDTERVLVPVPYFQVTHAFSLPISVIFDSEDWN
jgi:hypothetical protein